MDNIYSKWTNSEQRFKPNCLHGTWRKVFRFKQHMPPLLTPVNIILEWNVVLPCLHEHFHSEWAVILNTSRICLPHVNTAFHYYYIVCFPAKTLGWEKAQGQISIWFCWIPLDQGYWLRGRSEKYHVHTKSKDHTLRMTCFWECCCNTQRLV